MRAVTRYGSFLVRLWRRDSEPRVVVQHIQSGATLRGSSLTVAMAWMSAQETDAAERPPPGDETRATRDPNTHPSGHR